MFGGCLRAAVGRARRRDRAVRSDDGIRGGEQRRVAGHLDDRVEATGRRALQHQPRAFDVRAPHLVHLAAVHGHERSRVEHGVAAVQQAIDRPGVGHVTDDHVIDLDTQRAEHAAHELGPPDEQPHIVAGAAQRVDGMRADEAGPTSHRDAHAHSPDVGAAGVYRYTKFVHLCKRCAGDADKE
jgi:hypothetical protein